MRVALCQIPVGDDPKENLQRIRDALAATCDADLAVFPEAAQVRFGNDLVAMAEPLDGPFVTALRDAAREYGTALVAGVFEPAPDGRVYNTSVAIDASGELAGAYRKIHLFDAFSFAESEVVAPGDEPVVVELAGTRIGLVTCYDLRFPELFRALVDRGAEVIVIIAAWAQGVFKEEHWTTLVRARAIENTIWTVAVDKAPDMSSPPAGGRTGVGRSLALDPMGVVHADLGPFPAVRVVTIDQDVTARVRETLPSLSHRRLG
jgi:predicted amidohydrolase